MLNKKIPEAQDCPEPQEFLSPQDQYSRLKTRRLMLRFL